MNRTQGWKQITRWVMVAVALTAVTVAAPGPARAQDASTEGILITLDADSSQVNSLLQILAERSQLNIVTRPRCSGGASRSTSRTPPSTRRSTSWCAPPGSATSGWATRSWWPIPRGCHPDRAHHAGLRICSTPTPTEVHEGPDRRVQGAQRLRPGNRLVVKAPQAVIDEVDGIIAPARPEAGPGHARGAPGRGEHDACSRSWASTGRRSPSGRRSSPRATPGPPATMRFPTTCPT